jgi:TRAP-type C4-dicarboxylate transport system substrate-binding protein
MKNRKGFLCSMPVVLILVLGFAVHGVLPVYAAGTPTAENPVEFKFGHFVPPVAFYYKEALQPWGQKIEEGTNHRVKIVQYPSESLFKATESMNAVETGLTDIAHVPIAYFQGRFNLTEVFSLPFLSDKINPDAFVRTLNELYETTPEMQKEYDSIKLLLITCGDLTSIATTKKPIKTLEDLKGMKIRTSGRYTSKVLQRLGATPVDLPSPDLYDALSKGVVDGAMVRNQHISDFSINQVLPYWTDVPLWPSVIFHAMNKEAWESLPKDIQDEIMASGGGLEAALFMSHAETGPEMLAYIEELMKADGHPITRYTLPPEEVARWKEVAGQPVWDEWVAEMEGKGLPGRAVLDKAIELLGKYSKEN